MDLTASSAESSWITQEPASETVGAWFPNLRRRLRRARTETFRPSRPQPPEVDAPEAEMTSPHPTDRTVKDGTTVILLGILRSAAEADRFASDHLEYVLKEAVKLGLSRAQIEEATGLADWEVTMLTVGA